MMVQPIVVKPFEIPIHLGAAGFVVSGFGIAVLFAFLIAQVVSDHELRRRGHELEAKHVGDVLLAAVAGTLIGGKLYYVLVITQDWHTLISRGGFVYWGGFTGALIACWTMIRFRRLSFARYADVAGIAIAAGYAVGRTGCWAVGDDYGKWYEGPFAVVFPNGIPPTTAGSMMQSFHALFPPMIDPSTLVSVVPTQLIEVAAGLVMFGILWRLRFHTHAEGWLFGTYALLAGLERFLVEFLRIKDDRFFALSIAQCIAIVVALSGIAIMWARNAPAQSRREALSVAPSP